MVASIDPVQRSATDNDTQLARILEELIRQLQSGADPDLKDYAERFPQLADQVAELIPSIQTLVELGGRLDMLNLVDADVASPLGTAAEIAGTLGDFRLLRPVGRGGMGVVYEADQISLGRRVALKVLPFAAILDPQRLQRFKNEAIAAASLNHPNIVGVYCVGCDRGVHYFAMEFIDGQTLAEAMHPVAKSPTADHEHAAATSCPPNTTVAKAAGTTCGPQPSGESTDRYQSIARLGIQAAEALNHAHQIGIVHRDIKPANMLVNSQGKLWVTDFGLAHVVTDAQLTITGDILGTLRYMSPEQAAGSRMTDHRTDIYSLGATLYELLTGRPAFESTDRAELLRAIAEVEPIPLRKSNPTIPTDLATIVHKAMEKSADDRYATARELADDLQRFVEDRPIVARRPSLAQCCRRWSRRHTLAIAVAVCVLLVAVAGLTTGILLVGRQSVRAERNLQLALAALEQTLAESVVGDLIVEPVEAKRTELERRGIKLYEEFATKNGIDPTIWPAYRLLKFNQRLNQAHSLHTEDPKAAEVAYTDAISLARQLVAAAPEEPKNQARLIHCIDDYGVFMGDQRRGEEALSQSSKAEQLAASLAEMFPDFPTNPYLHGVILYNRGTVYEATKRLADAERCCRESLVYLKKAFAAEPNEIRVVYVLASCRYNLGLYLGQGGQHGEAEEQWETALRDWRALTLIRPLNSEYQSRAGATLSNLAGLARHRRDFERCRDLAKEALTHQERALALKPVYPGAKDFLRTHYKHLSLALEGLGDYEAMAACAEERVAKLSDVPFECCEAATVLAECALLIRKDQKRSAVERQEQAERYSNRAIALLDEASSRFADGLPRFTVAKAYGTVGDKLAAADRSDDSRRAWQSARTLIVELQAKAPPEKRYEFDPL